MRRTLAPSKKVLEPNFKIGKFDFETKANTTINVSKCDEQIANDSLSYFSVAYGKPSKKKHKSWDGDGILCVSDRSVTLSDSDGKEMGSTLRKQLSKIVFEEGATLYVGGKYVEILGAVRRPPVASAPLMVPLHTSISVPNTVSDCQSGNTFLNREFRSVLKTSAPKSLLKVTETIQPIFFPRPSANHIFRYNQNGCSVRDVILDPFIADRMRPHQIDGVIFLYECVVGIRSHGGTGAILADAMGLGKSVQSIALIWTLLHQGPYDSVPLIRRCLIVCPSSLVLNWKAEFLKWLDPRKIQPFFVTGDCRIEKFIESPSSPVLVVSYEMMTKHQGTIRDLGFDIIICDEAHRLKNSAIKTSLGVESLSIPMRVLLTGTPLQNDMDELYALSDFCNPGILGDSKDVFRKRFVDPISLGREPLASQELMDRGSDASTELQRITKSFMLRRTESVNTRYLPPKDELILFCRPSEMQLTLYRVLLNCQLIQKQLDDEVNTSGCDALSCILLLRKLCNDPSLFVKHIVDKENSQSSKDGQDCSLHSEVYKELCRLADDSQVWADLLSSVKGKSSGEIHSGKLWVTAQMLLALGTTEKIVVASHFTKTLDILQELCTRLSMKIHRIDGSTSTTARMKTVLDFNELRRTNRDEVVEVLLLSCKAGGEGLNLIGASRIILYDLDWNPATDAQTLARVWRDGQKKRVAVYRLVTAGTVEESLLQRQVAKQQLSSACVDRSSRTMAPGGFSAHELKDIFTLHTEHTDTAGCWTHHLLDCHCQTLEASCHSPSLSTTHQFSPPRLLINPQCQLGLMQTPPRQSASSSIAHLSSWTHWTSKEQIETSCTDMLILNAAQQLSCVFQRTISSSDESELGK